MLNYKKDRLDYGRQLNAPPRYKLDMAVATTYSLDLFALLSIPVALFYARDMDAEVKESRMDILNAIQRTGDSVKVYCQRGRIIKPKTINKLIASVEDCIYEVLPGEERMSFHPKIWVIRYVGPGQKVLYRVIILSRNLSLDRSYDMAFFLEGHKTREKQEKNKPLVDYLKHLTSLSDFRNSGQFIRDFAKTDFHVEAPFQDFSFHPMGFRKYENPLKDISFDELLIVSPFVDESTLKYFAGKVKGRKYLFSRKEELDKISAEILDKYESYAFSSRVVEGEEDPELQEEGGEEILPQHLHAKLFIGANGKKNTQWYLGSANCTNPALQRNEEFLIRLNTDQKKAGIMAIKETLLSKTDDLEIFEPYYRESREAITDKEFDFRPLMYKLLNFLNDPANITAVCEPSKDEKYTIRLTLKKSNLFKRKDLKVWLAPYSWKGDLMAVEEEDIYSFEGISLINLSPFVVWRLVHAPTGEEKEFMIKTNIALPEGRKQAIFRSIIENQEKFFQFIQFLLGENPHHLEFTAEEKKIQPAYRGTKNNRKQEAPLLEELMLAASREPEKLKEIDAIVKMLKTKESENLIPEDFNQFWQVFQKLIGNEK